VIVGDTPASPPQARPVPLLSTVRRSAVERARVRLGSVVSETVPFDDLAWPGAARPVGDDRSPSDELPEAGVVGSRRGHRRRRALPPSLAGARLALDAPGARALVALALVALVLAGWFGWRAAAATPVPVLAPAVVASGSPGAGASAASAPASAAASSPVSPGSEVVVDVAGRVRRPGLVRLPVGSRVADAIAAAGGALRGVDLSTINLAQRVDDGVQVVVGAAAAGGPPGAVGAAGAGKAATGPLDLNSATVAELDALPGVGPVLAQRIADWRQAHGRFSTVAELGEVDGIGDRRLGELTPLVRV
jgi:competence protein ComEA